MKFSIITPSFRNGRWLKLCIASVADQAGVEAEHIVQDAGSDDGTLDWLPLDKRVTAFVEKDRGMYDAINKGWRRATGDIVAQLNCDEQYLPGALQAVAEFFKANPAIDIVFADTVVVGDQGEYQCHRKVVPPQKYHSWVCHLGTFTCATFFRRRVLTEQKLYFRDDMRYIADMEWAVRAIDQRIPMGVLRRFTSAFTNTGENINAHPAKTPERERYISTAPLWAQKLDWALAARHRLRRWFAGIYSQAPFDYEIYTLSSPEQRRSFHVAKPDFRWRRG